MNAPDPLYFLVCFPLLWFAVTLLLGFVSGWFGLMERYPDLPEEPLVTLANQSGALGRVSMSRILKLSVCQSGLRIGMMRIFGPFSRDFFVPWSDISVTRSNRFFWKVATLAFGSPPNGRLTLSAEVADRVARAAGTHWREAGSFPDETGRQAVSRIAKRWAAMTGLAAAFFIIAPRLLGPKSANGIPILVAVLFPAIVFGTGAVVEYLRRKRP
jgi:hypothetical protein